jgi:uncharacterized protein (TIGR04255 family)
MVSSFDPINDDHAIERVSFNLGLEAPLRSEQVASLKEMHHLWAEDLPALREPPGFFMTTGSENNLQVSPAPSVEFATLRSDGTAVWSLRVVGQEAVVECTRYSRWKKIWGTAERHLDRLVRAFAGEDLPRVARVGLVVQDAFVTKEGEGDTKALFKETCFLPAFVFGAGANWHVHSGWFVSRSDRRMLSNLNIQAFLETNATDTKLQRNRLAISHILTEERTPDGGDPDATMRWINEAMDRFHLYNKEVLSELLCDSTRERIGLRGGSGS